MYQSKDKCSPISQKAHASSTVRRDEAQTNASSHFPIVSTDTDRTDEMEKRDDMKGNTAKLTHDVTDKSKE